MTKAKFPMVVKRGHTIVKIYQTPSRGCDAYTVSYYLGDKRQRKTFADLSLAVTEAEIIANRMSTGEMNVLTLTSGDGLAYVRAVEALKPTGVPLEMAAIQFAEAHKLLDGATVLEAARFYAKQNPNRLPKKLVPDVVAELVAAKEADGMSGVYVQDLRLRLGRFGKSFPGAISMVTSAEIEDFLRGLKLSGRSRNNYRRAVATMFYFAESRGYLPKGFVQVDSVAVAKEEDSEIEIFRPEELMRVLEDAEPELVPFIAIGAFAGLRHAEIKRLDWAEVRLEDGFIEVKASKAKTASRRLVPVTENLKLWLEPLRQASGKVCQYANVTKQLLWLAEKVNDNWQKDTSPGAFVWKHNALRHSFISYRVAQIQNVAQVALEAGNSPRMVFSNYRELVRPADAEKWFAVTPTTVEAAKSLRTATGEMPANVVALEAAVA
jgi:integrase